MKLQELEGLAREWTEECQSSLSVAELSNVFARALLAVLPVVRAAEQWRDAWGYGLDEDDCKLATTIDEMRRALEGK